MEANGGKGAKIDPKSLYYLWGSVCLLTYSKVSRNRPANTDGSFELKLTEVSWQSSLPTVGIQ